MQLYATITGDTDGIVNQGDEVHGKCCAGYFWCSPACRHNSSQCLLYFTGGLGWSMSEQMQKATIFNMPLAVAVAASWNEFVSLPMDYTSTFYWWQPDPTFLRKQPKKIIFPPHDPLASAVDTGAMSLVLIAHVVQTIAIMGMMSPRWSPGVKSATSTMQVFVLDVDRFNVNCIAGSEPLSSYTLEVLMFPSFAIFLLVAWGLSKVLGTRRWEFSKTFNTIGVFLQTGFGTMGAVAMKPLTCYLHPNGLRSLLKYPSVICGEGDHSAMLVLGVVLLSIFVIGFYALCMLAAWKLPYWSTQSHHRVRAFKFLTGKFCPNSWWFGLLLLARSCGFSMALVIATDSASEQRLGFNQIPCISPITKSGNRLLNHVMLACLFP
eukprot:g27169.t1